MLHRRYRSSEVNKSIAISTIYGNIASSIYDKTNVQSKEESRFQNWHEDKHKTSTNNRKIKQGDLYLWSKFGDYNFNGKLVMVRTSSKWSKFGFWVKFDLEGSRLIVSHPTPIKALENRDLNLSCFAPLIKIWWSWLEWVMNYHSYKHMIETRAQHIRPHIRRWQYPKAKTGLGKIGKQCNNYWMYRTLGVVVKYVTNALFSPSVFSWSVRWLVTHFTGVGVIHWKLQRVDSLLGLGFLTTFDLKMSYVRSEFTTYFSCGYLCFQ